MNITRGRNGCFYKGDMWIMASMRKMWELWEREKSLWRRKGWLWFQMPKETQIRWRPKREDWIWQLGQSGFLWSIGDRLNIVLTGRWGRGDRIEFYYIVSLDLVGNWAFQVHIKQKTWWWPCRLFQTLMGTVERHPFCRKFLSIKGHGWGFQRFQNHTLAEGVRTQPLFSSC